MCSVNFQLWNKDIFFVTLMKNCRWHFNHFSSKYSENLFSTFRNSSPDINNNFAFIFLSRKSKSIPEAQGNGEVEGI